MRSQQHINHAQTEASICSLRAFNDQKFAQMNNNICRFAGAIPGALARQGNQQQRQLHVQQVQQAQTANDDAGTATLSPRPKSLQHLWQEYLYDIGNRKAAR